LQLCGGWVEALQNLGVCELTLDEVQSALARFGEAHRLAPDHPDLEEAQGIACERLGRVDDARRWYQAAARRYPHDWLRTLRASKPMEPIAADEESIEAACRQIDKAIERADSETRPLQLAVLHNSGAEPPMLLTYQRLEVRSLLERYADVFSRRLRFEPPVRPPGKPHVGIVVTGGHEGVFVKCFAGIARRLAGPDLKVSLVCPASSANIIDHLCGRDTFAYVRIPARLDQAAQAIRAAGVHLLYYWEIGTDSINYFLPFLRAAPLQASGWGWPVTSANQAVDFYISAEGLDFASSAPDYRERLVRLPSLGTCFDRPRLPQKLEARQAFGVAASDHLYLCHQNLRKWHPQFDPLLEAIFQADPAGRLVFIADKQPPITEALLRRLRRAAPTAAARAMPITFLDRPRYLNLLAVADVALDTRIYGGGANTVYEAIGLGTPIVTWPAAVHRAAGQPPRWAALA
jgi:tetratricopeptide (TPR) repeat protein